MRISLVFLKKYSYYSR